MKTRHTKVAPKKATKSTKAAKNSATKAAKISTKITDLKSKTNKSNATNKKLKVIKESNIKTKSKSLPSKKETVKSTAATAAQIEQKNSSSITLNNKNNVKQQSSKALSKKNNQKETKEKTSISKLSEMTKTNKPKIVQKMKIISKKNSIAKRRKSRVASLDASAKMKVLTESDFRKTDTVKDESTKSKKDSKDMPINEIEFNNNQPKDKDSKLGSKSEKISTNNKKVEKKTNQKSIEKTKDVSKKISKKKVFKKKASSARKRNELGNDKAEIFDTKVYKRIASLNAAAIMAATSITATSLAGRKPVDHSDSDSDDELPQKSPISNKTCPSSSAGLLTTAKVQPIVLSANNSGSTLSTSNSSASISQKVIHKKKNSTKKNIENKSIHNKNENDIKIKAPISNSSNPVIGQSRKLEDLSSPKSAFSPCSPKREPEIIRIEIGPPSGSTGSSRTDGNTIKIPKPKKIKVQTIHLDNIKREDIPKMKSSSIPSTSSHAHHNNDNPSARIPTGSAFAQPSPIPSSTSHQIPVIQNIQNNTNFYPNFYPNIHHSQPNPVPMGMPVSFGYGQYPLPLSFPVVYTPVQPFSFANHLTPQSSPQPTLLSSPFAAFQRPQTSTTNIFGSHPPSSFLYQNGHDPTNMMFRSSPFHTQHSTVHSQQQLHHHHHHHHAHSQQAPRFGSSPIFPMTSNSMHLNLNNPAPSVTTSVTIEEIHDESGENEDVTIIPIVVQAPSDDDRSSLPSGSPRKKAEKCKTKFINGSSSSSKSTSNLNGIVHASTNVVTNCIDIDQFEGNRTSSNTATKTIHLPVNGNSSRRTNHPQSPVPPSTAKKKPNRNDPNVIEIVLDDPSSMIHKTNGPKNGSDRATMAVINNSNNNSNNNNNNKKDKKIHHGWSWQGEPFFKEVFISNDEKSTQKCFPAIRHLEGDVIRVRDCVLLKSGTRKNDLPFVAKIAALWESPGDEMNMSLLWYYRSEQVDVKSDAMPGEIFASRHKDVNSVACIEDKCFVLTYNQWCRYKAIRRRFLSQLNIRPPAQESLDLKSHTKLPPINTEPEMVFFSSRVYDYRQKRILKSG